MPLNPYVPRISFATVSGCLFLSPILGGGVYPDQWQWIGLALGIAALVILWPAPSRRRMGSTRNLGELPQWPLAMVLAWMVLPLFPIPPTILELVSPERWEVLRQARMAAGQSLSTWAPLSLAPAESFQRLMVVLGCACAYISVQRLASYWRRRIWILLVPVVVTAGAEALLGVLQSLSNIEVGDGVSGTYVNRNHFAGLLEMSLPLMLARTLWFWRQKQRLDAAGLVAISVVVFAALISSRSRMGFLAGLAGIAVVLMFAVGMRWSDMGTSRSYRLFRRLIPAVVPMGLLLLIPTTRLGDRFAYLSASPEVSTSARMLIWQDTMQSIEARPLLGSGLGTYERGLFPFKSAMPTSTLDYAHNDYLQVAAESGIPEVILLCIFAAVVLTRVFRAARGSGEFGIDLLGAGLIGSFVAIGLHSIADFNLYIPANLLLLAWIAGIGGSSALTQEAECAS